MDQLKTMIEQLYEIVISGFSIIKNKKNSSFLAKITTDRGTKFVVKSLFVPPQRQKFIVQSEQLLFHSGVRLAQPIPTKTNDPFFLYRGSPYVLYEWIEGPSQQLKTTKDLKQIAKTIAKFHKTSYGLHYPPHTKIYSHTDWLKEYSERLRTLQTWKKRNQKKTDQKTRVILQSLPLFYKSGRKAKKLLKKSIYPILVNSPYPDQSLVHGDMHPQNIINDGNRQVLIDFEDVRYDFPSKDLIRLLSMYTKKKSFSSEAFEQMLDGYKQILTLSDEKLNLLYIDFLFPHIFERMLRKKTYKKWTLDRIKHHIQQEKRKIQYIQKRYIRNMTRKEEQI